MFYINTWLKRWKTFSLSPFCFLLKIMKKIDFKYSNLFTLKIRYDIIFAEVKYRGGIFYESDIGL